MQREYFTFSNWLIRVPLFIYTSYVYSKYNLECPFLKQLEPGAPCKNVLGKCVIDVLATWVRRGELGALQGQEQNRAPCWRSFFGLFIVIADSKSREAAEKSSHPSQVGWVPPDPAWYLSVCQCITSGNVDTGNRAHHWQAALPHAAWLRPVWWLTIWCQIVVF